MNGSGNGNPIVSLSPNEYHALAMSKEADQQKIHERSYALGVQATRAENGLRGLMDEVGEIASAIKGWKEYGRPLDKINVVEEAGDAYWRLSQILKAVDSTPEEAMRANLRKLDVRWANKCEDHEESDRNRAEERKALYGYDKSTRTTDEQLENHRNRHEELRKSLNNKESGTWPATTVQDGHGFGHVAHEEEM